MSCLVQSICEAKMLGDCNTDGDTQNDERGLDSIMHNDGDFAYTPCISMIANSARYINTPGTIGMTPGIEIH